MKKILGVILITLLFISLTACGNKTTNTNKNKTDESKSDIKTQKQDKSMTQLYVNNYNGGYGSEWLEKAIADFQEKYKDYEFEPGKKGIQIWPGAGKVTGKSLMEQAKYSEDHIFMTESIFYQDYVSSGVMLDITDVLTENLTEFNEEKNIESKLLPEQKAFLNKGTDESPVYYAIPHYFGTNGIAYDVELFDQYKLFFDKNGNMTKKSTDSDLSLGGDNVAGTFDDGLPATYEQFFRLCDRLKNQFGCTPIIWSGQYQFYSNYFLAMLAAEANGKDGHMLTQTLSGTAKKVIKAFDENGITTESVTVDSSNRYQIYNQSGYYYALKFMKEIIDNQYYDENSVIDGFSHTDTQDMFIMSNREQSMDPIAMILEGNWWENEAESTFETMENIYVNAGRNDRKFGFMPLPKPNESYLGENHVLVECNTAYMFINANISEDMKKAAKMFIRYINTDEKLREFSIITNTPKALNYPLTEDDLSKMSYFGKSVNSFKNSSTTSTIYQCSTNPIYIKNMGSTFDLQSIFMWGSYSYPAKAFVDNSNMTVSDYYQGYINNWKIKFSKIN